MTGSLTIRLVVSNTAAFPQEQPASKPVPTVESVDLDRYVTDEALDGLFAVVAEQERGIREDPAQRSSELLRKVFGSR